MINKNEEKQFTFYIVENEKSLVLEFLNTQKRYLV